MSGEGGPFLIVDRSWAEAWQESDYEQVFGLGPAGGPVRVGDGHGVAWEAEGAAVVHVYRLDSGALLLQREWDEGVGAQEPQPEADEIGRLDVPTGCLTIFWSPLAWEDVTSDDMWAPPPPGMESELHSPPMANIGLQVLVPPGAYRCLVLHLDDAYRCWVAPASRSR